MPDPESMMQIYGSTRKVSTFLQAYLPPPLFKPWRGQISATGVRGWMLKVGKDRGRARTPFPGLPQLKEPTRDSSGHLKLDALAITQMELPEDLVVCFTGFFFF